MPDAKLTALITGGSSGIGYETCRRFLKAGYTILLTGLKAADTQEATDKLIAEFPKATIYNWYGDLSNMEKVDALIAEAHQRIGTPDVLVNNAGFGLYGSGLDCDHNREAQMIHLNIMALVRLTGHFGRQMKEQDRGHIINIASIAAFQPTPFLSTYGASKAFVLQYTMGLQSEFKAMGLRVRATAICPTPVRTGFEKTAGLEKTNLFKSWMVADVHLVADTIFEAVGRRWYYRIPGFFFHILNHISRRLPYRLLSWVGLQSIRERN
jgi:short-subunit dehydrogenase